MPGPKPIYTEDLHLVVDPPLKAALNSFAEASHTAVAQVVRTALREYLAKPETVGFSLPPPVLDTKSVEARASLDRMKTRDLTAEEREAKADDFYRANMAKGKK